MKIKNWLLISVLLAAFAVVGNMDRQDEVAAQDRYCRNVESGEWPAYEPAIECDMETASE